MTAPHLRLLGRPEARLGEQNDDLTPGQVSRLLALLAYRGGWLSRDELIFLFWPDRPESVARRNLRKLLHRARQRVAGIETEGERVRWLVSTDVQAWREALACRDWPEVFHGWRGPLAEGLERGAEQEYASWLEQERAALLRSLREAVLAYAREQGEADPLETSWLLERFLEVDPLDEEAVAVCLRCLLAAGRGEDAERLYQAFATRLEAELGVTPAASTQALLRERPHEQEPLPAAGKERVRAQASASLAIGADPRAFEQVAFVGRESEFERLMGQLAAALAGRGGAVAVEGEAGIGKTRLVEEALARAEGVRVFAGRCFERELGAPLEPVRDALGELAAVEVPQPGDARRFWAADPRDRSTIHQGLTAQLVAAARQQRGAVLFIDDLQWADAATLEFLSYAAKRVRGEPVLLIVSYRREDRMLLEGWLAHLAERRALQVMTLGRLEMAQVRALLRGFPGAAADALGGLAEFLFRESEGNPLFLVEYIRWLYDTAVVELDASGQVVRLHPERLPQEALPASVRTLIAARYQALPSASRAVLELAAVIGRAFDFELLEQVSELEPLALWAAFEPLLATGLLQALPGERYQFSHDKLRQTVYADIGPPLRRSLHARVAVALQRSRTDEAELAHHYLRAQAWEEAFAHLQAAAAQAEAEHAWEVAHAAYGRALEIVDRLADADRRRFVVLQALERLQEFMDRRPERAKTVARMLALAERLDDPKLLAEALLAQMAVLIRAGDEAAAAEVKERAIATFAELGDPAGEARVYRELAYAAWTRSDYLAALAASEEALRIYRLLGMRRAEAAISQNMAQAYRWAGQFDEAVAWAERAAAIYRELGDPLGPYLELDTRAWVHLQRGEGLLAVPLLEQLLPVCERLGDKHLLVEKHMNLGQIFADVGEAHKALLHFQAAAELGAEVGDPRHEAYPLLSAGATLEGVGEAEAAAAAYDQAARLLETAYAVSAVADEQVGQGDALTLLAGVLARRLERPEEALERFAAAEAIFVRHGDAARLAKVAMERGAMQWRMGRFEAAQQDFLAACERAREAGLPAREAAARASLGVVLRERGELSASVEASLQALEQLRRLGDQQAEALVLASLAESQRLAGDLAAARASFACSLELRRALGDEQGAASMERALAELG